MKNFILIAAVLSLAISTQAQDIIKKTDGTVIKGKVVSFQNNRLVIMQEDETEMTLPRKAVAEIKFDAADNKSVMTKGEASPIEHAAETPIPTSYAETPPPARTKAPDAVRYEAPAQIQAPAPVVKSKSVASVESPGEIIGLENRTFLSAAKFKEQAVGTGRVAVTICLNADGTVNTAKFKPAGSSTLDANLISRAVQNAKELKFSKGENDECGVITYRFNL